MIIRITEEEHNHT